MSRYQYDSLRLLILAVGCLIMSSLVQNPWLQMAFGVLGVMTFVGSMLVHHFQRLDEKNPKEG